MRNVNLYINFNKFFKLETIPYSKISKKFINFIFCPIMHSNLHYLSQDDLSKSRHYIVTRYNWDLEKEDGWNRWLKIGIQIFRYRWHGDQVWPKGTILQWRVSGLCLSSTAIWMSPYGGVVAYRLEWGASYACMYVCTPIYVPFQAALTRISWEQWVRNEGSRPWIVSYDTVTITTSRL